MPLKSTPGSTRASLLTSAFFLSVAFTASATLEAGVHISMAFFFDPITVDFLVSPDFVEDVFEILDRGTKSGKSSRHNKRRQIVRMKTMSSSHEQKGISCVLTKFLLRLDIRLSEQFFFGSTFTQSKIINTIIRRILAGSVIFRSWG